MDNLGNKMDEMTFTVPVELQSCALHADDNNGIVFPVRSQMMAVIGPFDIVKGQAVCKSGAKYKITIDAKAFKVTLK